MKVQDIPGYGMDMITIANEVKLPREKKRRIVRAALRMIGTLIKELGVVGVFRFSGKVKKGLKESRQLDWSELMNKGISQENLNFVIKKTVVAKAMSEMIGLERSAAIRREFSHSASYDIFEGVFASAEVFKQCGDGDFLRPFKEYYIALMNAMTEAGLECFEVVEDTKDTFQLNVTYCVFCEVARSLGNPYFCYFSSCYGDEVFFPQLCRDAGFRFSRKGTLATGKKLCDMRFERVKEENDETNTVV